MSTLLSQVDYKAILEWTPDLYLILNPRFEIVDVSNAYLKATMVHRDEILGKSVFEVFPNNPNDPSSGVPNLRASLERVLKNKLPDTMAVQKYDIRRPQSEGGGFEERYWSPVNSPVFNKQNQIELIIHRVEDVTEFVRLKKADKKESALAAELLTRVGQMEAEILHRSHELQEANKKLRSAKEVAEKLAKKAGEATRLKSEFLANISHELRTPLNGIIGFAELMYNGKVGPLAPQHKEYLGDILTSSRHLLELINDILDLSKIEAGKMEFHPELVNLAHLVNEVRDVLSMLVFKKQLHIEINIDAKLEEVFVDPSKLKQVLYNYFSNAIKFSADKGRIQVNAYPIEADNFRLEVKDEGVGIHAKDLAKLFIEFQQLDNSSTKKFPGTGLGLALTRRLVEAQGGQVGVESVFGEGSTFYVILPIKPTIAP